MQFGKLGHLGEVLCEEIKNHYSLTSLDFYPLSLSLASLMPNKSTPELGLA